MGEGVVLRFDGVGKRFRRRWALRDCALELPRGRIAALVGPNGAGKTTAFMLASGLMRPTSGRVDVLGVDPGRSGMAAGASFVAQDKPLYRALRVDEMLRAGAVLNARGRWDTPYVLRLVDEAGVGLGERVGELSPGQRARVALALALGRRPDLLLLDEPLAELDPLARKQVMATLLAEAAETGTTVLLSSHVIADLEDSCDYLVLLRDGRVRLCGEVEELLAAHRHLTGPADSAADPGAGHVVHRSTVGRQTTALIRDTEVPPGFRAVTPTLDDLVLGYLQQEPAPTSTGSAA
ncbi:ATP-binding cassette domain-containing protein [Pseudonocardia xinjiangensis]|uniref:ABC transporter ATP-binding protein n=1 Tax=Pseudonocardia xinjiangensis TaxID=75289 RepID=A0ABX1RCA1_9PSEU|nr:ABC transporter ATP-binding protein [Pseudonocardia xinjiangensis]NMH78017.1 ABC transporter ATP-binding protein [Pseudonocardia xinjiangensis]